MNYKMVILSTGLEVLAEVLVDSSIFFTAKRPLVITPVPETHDTYGLAFMPLSPADPDGNMRIFYSNIVAETIEIPESLINAYVKHFDKVAVTTAPRLEL